MDPAVRDVMPNWQEYFDLVGSLDRAHVVKALADESEKLDRFIVETQVPVIMLPMLLSKWKITHIDALVVDAEGYDWKIVKPAIDLGLRPKVILFEHSNLSPVEMDEVRSLLAIEYSVEDAGIDFLCLKKPQVLRTIDLNLTSSRSPSNG